MSIRRTKIVCTLGPSSTEGEIIRALMMAGMDIVRLNFSHGTHEHHRKTHATIRRIAAELNVHVAILADLQGPKIRTGLLEDGKDIELVVGEPFVITTDEFMGNAQKVSTSYKNLPFDVKKGDRILIADGAFEVHVERSIPPEVHCRVIRGGMLGQNKGMNLPGVAVSAPCLTDKDKVDLEFALELGVDYVALSFVRNAEDIKILRERMDSLGHKTPIVAKIERPEALECFDEILKRTDAVMVARGDLGVEVPLETVPQIQKDLIHRCNEAGKPVITATQMLESMMGNSQPTRAEVGDVANAIYDGTDAVMLSGETAAGDYPIEAVRVMADIAEHADEAVLHIQHRGGDRRSGDGQQNKHRFSDAIGQSVSRIVQMLKVRRIVCLTGAGSTALAMARYRPNVPITALCMSDQTARRCALIWGVRSLVVEEIRSTRAITQTVEDILLENQLVQEGDIIVVVAGMPLGSGLRTNALQLHQVGTHAR